jgi:hypothetical protein
MEGILGVIVGAVLTLVIFSYLLGDNVLYRWALALLVGSAIGYALGVAVDYVRQWITDSLGQQNVVVSIAYAVPLVLGVLLLLKGFSPVHFLGRIGSVGNLALAYLVGVGAAVAIAGALMGTLIPQVLITGEAGPGSVGLLGIAQSVLAAVGTVLTLLYFAHRPSTIASDLTPESWVSRSIRALGGGFLVFGLGTAFAGAITSALTALVIRLSLVAELLRPLIGQ